MKRKLECKEQGKVMEGINLRGTSDGKWSCVLKNGQIAYMTILQIKEKFPCFAFLLLS